MKPTPSIDQHILSAHQMNSQNLKEIMTDAMAMENLLADMETLAQQQKTGTEDPTLQSKIEQIHTLFKNRIFGLVFEEPSTRTYWSHASAALRLGMQSITEKNPEFSSLIKGETIPDMFQVISKYVDLLVYRSKKSGSADIAAKYSTVPIINAGDGEGEHPTQALLDFYTILKHFPIENLAPNQKIRITFVGDLRKGRTVHSLSKLLRNFPQFEISFCAPSELQIPDEYKSPTDKIYTDIITDEILHNSDIIYDTRVQAERYKEEGAIFMQQIKEKEKNFVFTPENVSQMKPTSILLHPLPRVGEITAEVDTLPQAKYFEQAENGIPVRMALIMRLLGLRDRVLHILNAK